MKISSPSIPTYLADNVAHGMTLRDYFAAAAMQGYMSNAKAQLSLDEVCEMAFITADKMMEARKK